MSPLRAITMASHQPYSSVSCAITRWPGAISVLVRYQERRVVAFDLHETQRAEQAVGFHERVHALALACYVRPAHDLFQFAAIELGKELEGQAVAEDPRVRLEEPLPYAFWAGVKAPALFRKELGSGTDLIPTRKFTSVSISSPTSLQMFQEILRLIAELRPHTVALADRSHMRR